MIFQSTVNKITEKRTKNTIIFNSKITISNIPDKVYEYVVNRKSAIERIMERYQVTVDKRAKLKMTQMIGPTRLEILVTFSIYS